MLKGYEYHPPSNKPSLQVVRTGQSEWTVGVFRTLDWTPIEKFGNEREALAFLKGVLTAETVLKGIQSALRSAA